MNIGLRRALVFVLLPAVAALMSFGPLPGGPSLQAGPTSSIHADVLEALQTESEVGVIVSLLGPDLPPDVATIEDLKTNAAARQASVLAALSQTDFTLGNQYEVVAALVGAITTSGVDALAQHPDVAAVHLNREIFPLLAESVPLIHADDLHDLDVTGAGIDVAVFDTGIDTDHPDLVGSLVHEHCVVFDFFGPRPNLCPGLPAHPAEDGQGHGTHVSGIVASDGDNGVAPTGVAPGVRIHAYKALSDGGFLNGTWGGVLEGLDHILDNHALEIEFINFSISSPQLYLPGQCEPPENPAEYLQAPALWLALQTLRQNGTVSFASAGNSVSRTALKFPACVQSVIAVGAVYDADVGFRSWFPCTDVTTSADQVACFSQASNDLDLLAPGSVTTSTVPGGADEKSGTSMASPHAVGVAALLLEERPDLNPTAPGLNPLQRLIRATLMENMLKSTGALVTDNFDPSNVRTSPRVDARVALLTNDADDFDQDGCTNGQEFGSAPLAGGERNPLHFWDFYDVWTLDPPVRDRRIDGFDIGEVVARFGKVGDPTGDPLTPPTDTTSYHTAFDRGGPYVGVDLWHLRPPNGNIDAFDIGAVVIQFGHSCA